MTTLYTISDDRTKFCRKAMKANAGVWNPVTSAWMFTKAGDHALTTPKFVERPSIPAPSRKRSFARRCGFLRRTQKTSRRCSRGSLRL